MEFQLDPDASQTVTDELFSMLSFAVTTLTLPEQFMRLEPQTVVQLIDGLHAADRRTRPPELEREDLRTTQLIVRYAEAVSESGPNATEAQLLMVTHIHNGKFLAWADFINRHITEQGPRKHVGGAGEGSVAKEVGWAAAGEVLGRLLQSLG